MRGRLMAKYLVRSRLQYLKQGDWLSVEGSDRVVRIESIILAARTFEASSFGPEGQVVKQYNFSQVLDICPEAEGCAYDRIIANSKLVSATEKNGTTRSSGTAGSGGDS